MQRTSWRIINAQGSTLFLVVGAALVCSIASYYILQVATAQAHQAGVFQGRAQARYLAEAALVITMEQLRRDPSWCPGPSTVQVNVVDAQGSRMVSVPISITNCGNASAAHVVTATWKYTP